MYLEKCLIMQLIEVVIPLLLIWGIASARPPLQTKVCMGSVEFCMRKFQKRFLEGCVIGAMFVWGKTGVHLFLAFQEK